MLGFLVPALVLTSGPVQASADTSAITEVEQYRAALELGREEMLFTMELIERVERMRNLPEQGPE